MYFEYKALKDGKTVVKKIEADSSTAVLEYLQNNNYFPISVKEVKENQNSFIAALISRVSFSDVVDLTRQIAIMLNAGLTLIDSLEILKKQTSKYSIKKM